MGIRRLETFGTFEHVVHGRITKRKKIAIVRNTGHIERKVRHDENVNGNVKEACSECKRSLWSEGLFIWEENILFSKKKRTNELKLVE
jgi:hypothetical protein